MTALPSLQTDRTSHLQAMIPPLCQIGWGAAAILRSFYRGEAPQDLDVQESQDGPVTAADLAVNHYILKQLRAAFPSEEFGYLSEETYKASSDRAPFPQPWVWIIDPLDGTRDFIDHTDEYAIHIALTQGGRPVLAVVVCPELEKLYYAIQGGGTWVQTRDPEGQPVNTPLHVSPRHRPEELALVVSRTHRDDRFNQLINRLPIQQFQAVGSVGCKIGAIVDQRADVYISLSGKSAPKDWDMAAPELILTEAGGQFTHFDGTPLRYNTGDVNQWGALMASNGHCHGELCHWGSQILAEIDGCPPVS